MNEKALTRGETEMRTKTFLTVLLLTLLLFAETARAVEQKTFATADEAVQALVKASKDGDQEEMLALLGDEGKDLVYSGDTVQDKARMERFVKAYSIKHTLVSKDERTRILQVGANDWPMPIPLVNDGGKWRFDTAAGKQELLFRRIGRNELGAIAACRGFIDAQKDYASVGHDGLPAGIYAARLMSDPGKQDGLYWETKEDEPASPAGPFLAKAGGEGYGNSAGSQENEPYHGYFYRILKAQGAAAKGGAKSYLSDGKLTGGVALVAYPAQYKASGVMTFIINQRGVVYQKDLGENTLDLAAAMTEYNPDSTWKKVTD
jgi:Protein of unknown function (DUF2950)